MKKKVLAVMMAAAMFCPAAVYAAEPAAQEETENSGETAPADFQMNPYDGNDMNNYTLSGEYTGSRSENNFLWR